MSNVWDELEQSCHGGHRNLLAQKAAISRGRLLEAVAEAARKVGMNWKIGAPYGHDALDEAIRALDGDTND